MILNHFYNLQKFARITGVVKAKEKRTHDKILILRFMTRQVKKGDRRNHFSPLF